MSLAHPTATALAIAMLLSLSAGMTVTRAEDPFAAAIRPTDPRTPEEERRSFRVPPGFAVQLVASEPEIQKPMNLAFDARGRLWVSGSTEYPYPAPADRPGQDSIRILEDRDGDGRADQVTVFAEGLSIPIGLYPYRDGAIVYSIPYIEDFQDRDGDGKADQRERLYGPLGYDRDTHGMNNAFRRGFDGWMYANHGWANSSTIQGKDGSRIDVQGGNTYRVRLDGSRVEWFTHGQVNPFGMTFDPMGDLYNADCHTRPIMLLMRNGYYDSFGKPHNGLGYVPAVMEHTHGSTAIAGTTRYTGTNFPAEYRGNMFVGNVMTSRVNRDAIGYRGSSPYAIEQPDFLISDDPWFRPVDIQVGPDGALYIADFYNKIIGHVEVPLNHPERDKVRGRIWRVVYKGEGQDRPTLSPSPDLRAADAAGLIAAFDHPVLGVRMRAGDELADRIGPAASEPLRVALGSTSPTVRAHALWALFRLGAIRPGDVTNAARDADPLVRTHAMRVLSETAAWDDSLRGLARAGLDDSDPFVQRTAVDAIGQHPDAEDLSRLLAHLQRVPEADAHLRHGIKLALLETIRKPGTLAAWSAGRPTDGDASLMAEIALALPSPEAGAFLIEQLQTRPVAPALMGERLRHAARHLPADVDVSALARIAQAGVADDVDLQLDLLLAIREGLRQRGESEPESVRSWGTTLASRLLESVAARGTDWVALDAAGQRSKPWRIEPRRSADGTGPSPYLSSLPLGEGFVGTLQSRTFEIPATLSLSVCGHLGPPDQPVAPRNLVRVRLVATGQVLGEALAPRNDVAKAVTWDLSAHAGQLGVIEVVDGLNLPAYAWIAVARVEPPVVSVPTLDPEVVARRATAAAQLVEALGIREQEPAVRGMARDTLAETAVRAQAARTLVALRPDHRRAALVRIVGDPALPAVLREFILTHVVEPDAGGTDDLMARVAREIPSRLQSTLAESLAETDDGAALLLTLAERGSLSPQHLRTPTVEAKLTSHADATIAGRYEQLMAALPPVAEQTRDLIAARSSGYRAAHPDADRGRVVFEKNCAACHQIGGKGSLVGPQLDGVGLRGAERLIEDILDPSRNVDPAFFATLVALHDGRVLSGLVRREEGPNLILVDRAGQEQAIPTAGLEERRATRLSPMPGDFGQILAEAELYDLVTFLVASAQQPTAPVSWRTVPIDRKFRSEGVAVADVNRDGRPDILAGELWYEAPNWVAHEITTPGDYGDGAGGYSRCFFCFADDVNHDGWPDAIVIGTPGEPCVWYENPQGKPGPWPSHRIAASACNETPLHVDLLGDGRKVLVMGTQPEGQAESGQMAWFAPGPDPTQPWVLHAISPPSTPGHEIPGTRRFAHGLGAGDLNGDGRLDVLCTDGWWEQPAAPDAGPWPFHPAKLGEPAAHMQVVDVDADGQPDVVSSSAHAYGIWAHLQRPAAEAGGAPGFERQDLFPKLVSQTHALLMEDLDGDGLKDLATGKRFWAHGPKGDPGSDEPAVLYWFRTTRGADGRLSWTPFPVHPDSGVGLHFAIADVNGDGAPDLITSNKKGVYLHEQVRPAPR